MKYKIDFRKNVRYERMHGIHARAALDESRFVFLPIGCLERHGDHLPMGLDVMKAHLACCVIAQCFGGAVLPPHYYAGVHFLPPEFLEATNRYGNLYADKTAENHLEELIRNLEAIGVKNLVLYSGHYPVSQNVMVRNIAARFRSRDGIRVVPFYEKAVLYPGDHAGVCETSLLLYLDRQAVDMTAIGERNYREHSWTEENTPEKASVAKGEAYMEKILAFFESNILTGNHPELPEDHPIFHR